MKVLRLPLCQPQSLTCTQLALLSYFTGVISVITNTKWNNVWSKLSMQNIFNVL